MENFDLNINNYSIQDLEHFFKLDKKKTYSSSDVELIEYKIREQMLSSGHIDNKFRKDFIDFLDSAKILVIQARCKKELNKKPTTIPGNYPIDPNNTLPPAVEMPTRNDEIIERPQTQFVYSNQSDFFPGKLNPLNTRIITKSLNIDTKFRDNIYRTSSSDFTLQLPTKFSKVVSMGLSSIEFPLSFYGTSQHLGNNFLYLKVIHYPIDKVTGIDLSGSLYSEERIFTVPDGNYNSADLISTLNSLISPKNRIREIINPNDIFSYIELHLDVSETGSGSGKVIIRPSGVFADAIKEIQLDFTRNKNNSPDNVDVNTRLGWNLGFIRKKYLGGTSYTSDTIIEPAPFRYIYLAIDDFNNNSNNQFISVFKNSIMSPNIIARLSLKSTFFSLLMENDFTVITEPRRYFGPVDIQKLKINLYDERGRLLDMNNANFSFCLELKMLYDL